MPAYNFSPEFADVVESGRKCSTIRQSDKGAKIGDTAYLYTGQRTKDCRLLGTATLISVVRIWIYHDSVSIERGCLVYQMHFLDIFARSDGFNNFEQMVNWLEKKYNIKSLSESPFIGYLHTWTLNKEVKNEL